MAAMAASVDSHLHGTGKHSRCPLFSMNSTTAASCLRGDQNRADQICQDILFEGLPGPVRLVLPAGEMEEAFSQYAFWPHACVSPVGESGEPLLLLRLQGENEDFPANIEVDGDGPYVLEKDPTLDLGVRREESLAAGLCSLNIAMVTHLCRSRGLLCLHGALLGYDSEDADAGLLLLGNKRAGKSTLTVRLMAEGLVSHGDDMLGLEPRGTLVSLGLAPRLRLPLPASARLADFVAEHCGTGDDRATFLAPNAAIMSPFGTRCRARHIVVLERRDEKTTARLATLSPREVLEELVFRFFLQEGTALLALECATCLARTVPCHTLVYSDLDEACALLASLLTGKATGGMTGDTEGEEAESVKVSAGIFGARPEPYCVQAEDAEGSEPQISAEQEYRQCAGAELVTRLGRSFLVNNEQSALHVLNETGRILWLMLADPISLAEASLLVREAYPMISESQIEEDVRFLFADLLDARLIEPA